MVVSGDTQTCACRASSKWLYYFAWAEIVVSICGTAGTSMLLVNGNYNVKEEDLIIEEKLPKFMLIGTHVAFLANLVFGIYLLLGNGPGKGGLLWRSVVVFLIAAFCTILRRLRWWKRKSSVPYGRHL